MTTKEALSKLIEYQKWRTGEVEEMPQPKEITKTINSVIAILQKIN
jgi:hypothetical protein